MKTRRLLTLVSLAALISSGVAFALYITIDRPTPIDPMSIAIAKINVGASADEADAAMGMPPVAVTKVDGYLLGPMTMLTADNELTPKDQVELFTLRRYTDGGLHYATVALRSDGTVAGKWTGRIQDGG